MAWCVGGRESGRGYWQGDAPFASPTMSEVCLQGFLRVCSFSETVMLTSALLQKAACKIGRALFSPPRLCLW